MAALFLFLPAQVNKQLVCREVNKSRANTIIAGLFPGGRLAFDLNVGWGLQSRRSYSLPVVSLLLSDLNTAYVLM